MFGFITWLNSILIPYLKLACELKNFESLLVTFAFYISYLVMAIPSAWILQKTGLKNGMIIGLLIMCLGTLLFLPAAWSRTYYIFLLGLFIMGSGLAIIQAASNPYIAVLGPIESAAKRISIMGICNKIAGALSPLILGGIFLKNTEKLESDIKGMNLAAKSAQLDLLASRVILPYSCMAVVLILMALFIYFSHLPDVSKRDDHSIKDNFLSVLSFPNLVLGFIALFLYVGVEVIAADTISGYGQYWGFPLSKIGIFATFTLSGMVIGYIFGIILIPKYISQSNALLYSAVLGIFFTTSAVLTTGIVSICCIAALGLANALIWPALWPLSINRLGNLTATGSAILVMGISGGAILPLLYGRLADLINQQQAYWIIIPCYAFIIYYSLYGSKKIKW